MRVIQASEDQLGELAKLQKVYMQHHTEFDDYFQFERDMSKQWINHMKKLLKQEDNILLVAVENGTIIGYMTASIIARAPIYKIQRVGLIGDNFVLPEHRRKGAFSKMLEKTLSWMETKGIRYVEHPIAARNKLGLTVWKKKGFRPSTILTKREIRRLLEEK